jgi:hypothetical protein
MSTAHVTKLSLSPRTLSNKRFAILTGLMALAISISGCGEMIVRFGELPDTDALETALKVDISEMADVKRILGEPDGVGEERFPPMGKYGVMLPTREKPRTVWTYHYIESTMQDSRQTIVWVFFADDVYDGYMWFSSNLQKMDNK